MSITPSAPGARARKETFLGRTIGPYRLEARIGMGGMGAVYLARAPDGGSVAVKVLHEHFAEDPETISRFMAEAKGARSLRNQHVVEVREIAQNEQGECWFVMEYLDGESLRQRLVRDKRLPLAGAVDIAVQIAEACAEAHAQRIYHRDLKPDNVFLCRRNGRDDFVKILDFGVAKFSGGQTVGHKTKAGTLLGTPAYISPEQCSGRGTIDARSDVYSLGMMLYEMLTGRTAFADEPNMACAIIAHMNKPPPPPRQFLPELPAAADAILLRCLAKRPDDRFETMDAVRAALAPFCGSGAAAAGAAPGAAITLAGLGAAPGAPAVDAIGETLALGGAGEGEEDPAQATIAMDMAELIPEDAGEAGVPTPPPLPADELFASGEHAVRTLVPPPRVPAALIVEGPPTTTMRGGAGEIGQVPTVTRRPRGLWIAAAAAVVLAAAGGFAGGRWIAPDPAADAARQAAASPLPATVSVQVESDPEGAEVLLRPDGPAEGRTPLTIEVPRSEEPVAIGVRLAGYAPGAVTVRPREAHVVKIVLGRLEVVGPEEGEGSSGGAAAPGGERER